MRTIVQALWGAGFTTIMACVALQAHAQDATPTAEELAAEIQAIKQEYEARIQALERQLEAMTTAPAQPAQPATSSMGRRTSTTDNVFNPAIGLVLDARFSTHSADHDFHPAGFQVGHGAERPAEGLALGHPEVTLTGNVDDKFFGAATVALDAHPGEAAALELEEVYIQTLPGAGLPDGARIKAGRALWTFGYLNEIHLHADDFSDRPLPYRAFLHHTFNDDGLELSYVLPTDIYAEVGGGLFRGDDFPFAGSANGRNAWSAYGRIGGDFGRNGAWRIGAYMLAGEARNRSSGAHDHGHGGEENGHDHDAHDGDHAENGHDEDEHNGDEHAHEDDDHHEDDEHAHEDEHDHDEHAEDEGPFEWANIDAFVDGEFSGDATMYAVDARLTWAPTGNPREQEMILQGEVFWRVEDGKYSLPGEYDTPTFSDSNSMGFYVQGIYKLNRNFRVGARYARLNPPDIPAYVIGDPDLVTPKLDDSVAYAVMADWTNSEFSRIRLQYNREEVHKFVHGPDPDAVLFVEQDDQILLQYIMSLGAHAAHTF